MQHRPLRALDSGVVSMFFVAFMFPDDRIDLNRFLLKTGNGVGSVIGLVPALLQGAGQQQFSRGRRSSSFDSVAVIQREENG
jgi:hypothetical protein